MVVVNYQLDNALSIVTRLTYSDLKGRIISSSVAYRIVMRIAVIVSKLISFIVGIYAEIATCTSKRLILSCKAN